METSMNTQKQTTNNTKLICLDDLHHIFDNEQDNNPHNTRHLRKDELYRRLGITSRDSFARKILPVNIYLVLTAKRSAQEVLRYNDADKNRILREKDQVKGSRSTLNRVFNNVGNSGAKERCRQVVALLVEKSSLNYDTYSTNLYRKEIADRWRDILAKLQAEEKNLLRTRIRQMIDRFPERTQNCDNIKKRLQATAANAHMENILASLTLIACTLHIWNQYDSDFDFIAQDIILLPLSETEEEQLPSKMILNKNAKLANEQLDSLRPYIDNTEAAVSDPQKCYHVCQNILNILPLDDKAILGRTYYILYLCCMNSRFVSPDGIPAAEFLRQSQKYQYDAALKIISEQNNSPLYSTISRSKSSRSGLCVTNVKTLYWFQADNGLSSDHSADSIPMNELIHRNILSAPEASYGNPHLQTLLDSSPENWTWKLLDNKFCNDPSVPIKYFLFDRNEEKNYTDLLKVLSYYKLNGKADYPYDVEIYILGNSSQIGNLVDTAQQKMPGPIVPVHIINEERRSAQLLLAKHPLFFPVMEKLKHEEMPKPKTLHFVILGSDECAEYLAREASWMMTFPRDTIDITPKITVVGHNSSVIQQHLLSKCPGLQDNEYMTASQHKNKNNGTISELYAADLKAAIQCSCRIDAKYVPDYNSIEFEKFLFGCLSSGETLYFAISLQDSMASLAAAISLREKIIQYCIAAKCDNRKMKDRDNTKYLNNMPPIAFRCTDYNIAHMSKDLVVSKVDHGFSWYNNHMIIPFGTYYELYGWDHLTNNLAECLSQCIHMLYGTFANTHCSEARQSQKASAGSNKPASSAGQGSEADREHAFLQKLRNNHKMDLADYYKRQYNKDSSFSVALSMSYRLFCYWLILKSQKAQQGIVTKSKEARQILSSLHSYDTNYTNGFFNLTNLNTLADACSFLNKGDAAVAKIVNKIASWEHSKWINWMISEGWLPASIERVRFYKKAGSSNNQLYIGKLHPALCSWNRLKEVEDALRDPSNTDDSGPAYRKYDMESIRNTGLLLRGACELHRLEQSDLEPESSKD